MRPQINYVASSFKPVIQNKLVSPLVVRQTLRAPFILYQYHTPLDFFSTPVRHMAFLRALSVTCDQFAAVYRADPAAAVYAIQYVMDDSLLTTGGRYAYSLTAEQIARQIYDSCVLAYSLVPGKYAGLAMGTVAGLDVKSVLIGAALGALAMHLSMK